MFHLDFQFEDKVLLLFGAQIADQIRLKGVPGNAAALALDKAEHNRIGFRQALVGPLMQDAGVKAARLLGSYIPQQIVPGRILPV